MVGGKGGGGKAGADSWERPHVYRDEDGEEKGDKFEVYLMGYFQ